MDYLHAVPNTAYILRPVLILPSKFIVAQKE
jgi:hypothetical protein